MILKQPIIAVASKILFGRHEIEEYEKRILANPTANERDASKFFEKFPKFLLLGSGAEIKKEVVLYNKIESKIERVDFFRRNYGKAFWDIIELKSPNARVISGLESNHPRPSSQLYKALNQAFDYKEHIQKNKNIRIDLLTRGIRVYQPQIIVILGQIPENVDPELIQDVYSRARAIGSVDALTYSDILAFAKEHYKTNSSMIIAGQIGTREEQYLSPDNLFSDQIISEAVESLPEVERVVVSLYYYEKLTMKEIGKIMDVSSSRISQILKKAILQLKGRFLETGKTEVGHDFVIKKMPGKKRKKT